MEQSVNGMNDAVKVVIGDDHETFLMYMSILLKRMGFSVIPAHDGFEVIKLMKLFVPDAVLLDVSMPKMDGVETLRYIKNDENFYKTPVIMVSSILKKDVHDSCLKLGCSNYLTKPVNVTELNKALQECLIFSKGKKRKHLRTSVLQKTKINYESETREYYALNLSSGGVYVRTKRPLPINSKVEVLLDLEGGGTLSLKGTVIYHKDVLASFQIEPGMAVRFDNCTVKEYSILDKYIRERLAGDLIEEQEEKVISIDDV